ncbi:hypothetical protein TREMEDRAFT_69103 [Tremella mesenterica DSM 1558]|uniref:uncharacterized protein n=1 Tax=Tremella mesenterica (strain ATCC 24925 / CBS 8224 / DSM 1558 / NBRC 9311 / NRRL Y-6157 / RJB 2259-6 / UBC 559-6) TaxID=578456 RepID=UPI0003F4A31D|nr:uncharacterized protein TREMEDRAFT_69103 [Tremella mesenterica DSM 1558]EIW68626.1 hypothetical protein TREMEDRAFT_69103 [Tremella mesenterica DSM 1558]
MSQDEAGMSEAARRAAARKAKILARGNAGLTKLAHTARGEEADKLYGEQGSKPISKEEQPSKSKDDPMINTTTTNSSFQQTPPPSSSTSPPTRQPSLSSPSNSQPPFGQNSNEDLQTQMNAFLSMFGPPGSSSSSQSNEDMSQLFSQLFGAQSGGVGLLGDSERSDADFPQFPPGVGGEGLGGFPSLGGMEGLGGFPGMENMGDLGNALGALGALSGNGGLGGMGMVSVGKPWIEKVFPLVHAFTMIIFLVFCVGWWEPNAWPGRNLQMISWRDRWGSLGNETDKQPVFWAFATIELLLQTTRFFILKSPPPPHALLAKFLPLLPPRLGRPLLTGSRYLTLILQTYKDACLLIFCLGIMIIIAGYRG